MKKVLSVCMLAAAFLLAAPLSAQTPVKQDVKKECPDKKKECPDKKKDCKDKKECCKKGENKNCPAEKKDVKEKK